MKKLLLTLIVSISLCSLALAGQTLIVASTMSPYDTGLYTDLLPKFEQQYDCKILLYSLPTGKALGLLQSGAADVAIVHDRKAEDAVLLAGFGTEARDLMYNDFVLVGPLDNPAGIDSSMPDVKTALAKVRDAKSKFYSRSDLSGTHQKEMSLWQTAGIDPIDTEWYSETGLGTVKVLAKADKNGAYTLADRATWLAYGKDYPNLKIVCQHDKLMLNYIRVITGSPAKYPHINYDLAVKFVKFMLSPEVQEMIRVSGVDKYGEPLYIPDAKNK
jgi:tungstate transport system substrate-binding protein